MESEMGQRLPAGPCSRAAVGGRKVEAGGRPFPERTWEGGQGWEGLKNSILSVAVDDVGASVGEGEEAGCEGVSCTPRAHVSWNGGTWTTCGDPHHR